MRVLVTGGAGYIGSHTAQYLHGQGIVPIVLDDLSTGHREFVRWGPFEQGDIRDVAFVLDVLERHAIDAVIHFAAKALVSESVRRPEAYASVNVSGTESLLRAMQQAGVKRLVFSSSCAVYGPARTELMDEQHPLAPVNPYGETKLHAEQAIAALAPRFGLRWAVLRYFNVAGADSGGELFEWHEPETHVVPNLLHAATTGSEFSLYGATYPTPDGSAIRDYVDVTDLARTHVEALDILEREPSIVSNVGTGQGVSVRELITLVEQVTGHLLRVRVGPPRPGDPPRLVADNRRLLAWSKSARRGFIPLRDTLDTTLRALRRTAPGFPLQSAPEGKPG